ncbi:MAG: endo alpha-1,4 polygalactosaminidase [Deltaproteobacteria bacterium]|nr:endo alpha-1,4 polygalactosaminidase [Deltaproteobacteria bacterium]MCW5803489.1 endo alpha-1,4 polygalactosaminidase [Deltaproteobacteria bacterium]
MALRRLLLACAMLLGACGDDGPVGPSPDASEQPPWWQPAPGAYHNWDIQLYAPFDTSGVRDMYVLDLFQVLPAATMVDYGDGEPVTFPAGSQATAIAQLHGRGAIVVCRVNVGAINPMTDPDAAKFPAAIRGINTMNPNDADEVFVDIRTAARATWSAALQKRIELAKLAGCDAIDADKSLQIMGVGFNVPFDEQKAFHLAITALAHSATVQLSIGLRNGFMFSSNPEVVAAYDFGITEGMAATTCCDEVRPFIDAGKAAFAIDYLGPELTKQAACAAYRDGGMRDGLLKDETLSSAVRDVCE